MKGAPSFGKVSLISILIPISAEENVTLPVALPVLTSAEYMAPGGLPVIIGAAETAAAPAACGRGHIFTSALARAAQKTRIAAERIVIERKR